MKWRLANETSQIHVKMGDNHPPDWLDISTDGWGVVRYVPERTCRKVAIDGVFLKCSECGQMMGDAANYCKTCGARVMK